MSQIIQIKRTTGVVSAEKRLYKGELAYSSHDDKLYIGAPDQTPAGNVLGEAGDDPPVIIGGLAYTEMLAPSIPDIATAGGNQAASLVLGDAQMTMTAEGIKDDSNQRSVSITAPDDIGTSYSVVMPTGIGLADQVLSITSIVNTGANLGWIDVTSTIEGADDSLVTTPTNGQVLIYTTDMDGPLL